MNPQQDDEDIFTWSQRQAEALRLAAKLFNRIESWQSQERRLSDTSDKFLLC